MAALGSLVVKLALEYAQFTGGLDKTEQAALAAAKRVQDTFDSMKSKVAGIAGSIAGGLAAGFTISAFKSLIMDTVNSSAALNDLAIQTGSTVEALSGLASIGQYCDVSADMIGSAMNKLSKTMAGATEESKGAGKAIEALGINFDDFKKMKPEDQMMTVAKAMDESADGTGKSAIAMAIYGKEGAKMLPFLKDLADAGELQAKVTAEQAAMSDNFADNLTKLQVSGEAWKKELALGIIPALDLGVQALVDVTNGSGGLRDEVRRLAADGSLKEWTKAGITGLTYVADAAQLVIRGVKSTAESLGAYAAAGVAYFGGIGAAIRQAMAGDFTGAVASMKSGMDSSKAIIAGLGENLISTFGEATLGSKIRARMAEIEATGETAEKAKPKLDFTNVLEKTGKAAKDAKDPLDALLKSVSEHTAMFQAELDGGEKLTAGQKLYAKAMDDVRTGALNLTGTQKELLATELKKLLATERSSIAYTEQTKALHALYAENLKQVEAYEKTVDSLVDQDKALREEIEIMGLSLKGQLELTQARTNATIATKQQELASIQAGNSEAGFMSRREIALAEEIRLLQNRNVLLGDKAALQQGKDSFKSVWESADRTAHDVFVNIFEGGQDLFTKLKNTGKSIFFDWLYQMTLKKWVFSATMAVTGTASNIASAATGQGGGMLSNLSSANSLYSLASTGYAATLGSGVGAVLGATAGNAAIATAITGSASSATAAALAASQAAGTATAASATLASVGSSIAVAVPYIAAALAAAAIVSSLLSKKDSRVGGGYSYDFATGTAAYGGGPDKSFTGAQAPIDAINATVAGINGLLKTIGSSSALTSYYAASETSTKGRGGVMSGGMLSNGVAFGEDNAGSNYDGTYFESSSTQSPDLAAAAANFATDLKQSIIQALQAASDVPDVIKGMVAGIDIELSDSAAVDKLLGDISKVVLDVTSFQQVVKTLPFAYLRDMSFDAAGGLIAAAGGIDALGGKLSSYYENFYSEEEKRGQIVKNIVAVLSAAGSSLSAADFSPGGIMDTRDEFRALVQETDKSSPLFMALLNVNQVFADITPVAEAAVVSIDGVVTGISDAMKSLQADRAGLDIELMRAQGNTAGADAAQFTLDTSGMSDLEVEAFRANAGIRTLITTLTDAATASIALAATNQTWTDRLAVLTGAETDRSIALRDTTDESTRALMRQVYAQEDLKTATDAAATAATALTATNQTWTDRLAILTGAETDRSIALRDTTDESTRALMRQVYAQQDLKTATDAFIASEKTAVADTQAAVASARTDLVSAYKEEASAMQSTVDRFRTFSSSLRLFRDGLLMSGLSPLTPAQRYAESKKQFDQAQAGGDAGQIQSTASAFLEASKVYNASSGAYVSDFQAVQAALTLAANTASATADVAQLQLDAANSQLGLLGSINSGVLSVADALAALATATAASSVMSSGGALAGAQGYSQAWMQNAIRENLAAGYTANQIISGGMSNYGIAEADIRAAGKAAGIPGFRIGTNYVPRDMLAQIHEGEAIVPKAYNPAAGAQGQSNEALLAEVRALRQDGKQMREEIRLLREQNNQGHVLNVQATVQGAATSSDRKAKAAWSDQQKEKGLVK